MPACETPEACPQREAATLSTLTTMQSKTCSAFESQPKYILGYIRSSRMRNSFWSMSPDLPQGAANRAHSAEAVPAIWNDRVPECGPKHEGAQTPPRRAQNAAFDALRAFEPISLAHLSRSTNSNASRRRGTSDASLSTSSGHVTSCKAISAFALANFRCSSATR